MDSYDDFPCFYEFFVRNVPDAHSRVYVAKIVGSDPKYIFSRRFLPLSGAERDDGQEYWTTLDDYGVYERSVKWFADAVDDDDAGRKGGDRFLFCNREWFVVLDGVIDHSIQLRRDVLPEVKRIKKFLAWSHPPPDIPFLVSREMRR